MILVEFLANDLGPRVSARAEARSRLVDACDAARAPVLFSCRSASCGTCRVEVLEGADLLDPPAPEEAEVLEIFESPPSHRLACSARLGDGEGRVVLRWAGGT